MIIDLNINSNNSFFGFQTTWRRLETFHKKKYNEKIPPCIKSLLSDAGYDTLSRLKNIDEEKVKCVEEFLAANKTLVDKLKCCHSSVYKQLEHFQFLPGHKTVIMSLPDEIREMERNNMRNKESSPKNIKKNSLSDEELKENLIKNLTTASGKAGFQIPRGIISELNLVEFERFPEDNVNVCKCRFSCPFCSKTFSLIYKTFWMSSNATKHLKTHVSATQQ